MANFTQDLKNAQLWPIKAKGKVTRLNPLGDPSIEQHYHAALEQGRVLERNIGDANHWLQQKKKDLMEKISLQARMNQLAVDGQLSNPSRAIKYVVDSINILKDVNKFQQDIIGLIQAVTQNIGMLQSMEANMVGMVQQNLNALAMLLHDICNWGLPDLPAIPNLFSDTIWRWNGFNFVPLSAFALTAKSLKFDTNFAFNQCVIHIPNINIFRNYPTSISTYSGLQYGTTAFVPPLGGLIPNTGVSLSDPNFISTMENTTTPPYFLPPTYAANNLANPFSVNNSMLGAVPDPTTIISNYKMPATTYRSNIVSIVPTLRDQTVEPSDPDYVNPNLTVRNANLRKALVHYVTLGEVVASNFDPNLTAAWLFYMNNSRVGRAGSWISNFQTEYATTIAPSLVYLTGNDVPWNCVLPSTKVNDAPTAIPIIASLTGTDAVTQGNMLWKLSYIEASLLGYTRNQSWDAYANMNYISSYTGTDLDYQATPLDSTVTSTVVLGATEAQYPVEATFPSAMGDVMQEVINIADTNIKDTPTYVTTRPQFKYIYNQFAVATEVDRFTQFWRTFNANLQALLLQDPYLVQFVVSYPGALDSAIDPLGDPSVYNQIKTDVATRNRSWIPGTPLLNIPVAPIVDFSTPAGPDAGQSGWQGTNFDPNTFLLRPDIQQLPIGTQIAMLRTNLSYAATQQMGTDISNAIQSSIQQNQLLLQDFQNIGFKVETLSAVNSISVGSRVPVSFDKIDFDLTGNVTTPSSFTIQKAGDYALVAALEWAPGAAGVRSATIFLNGTTALSTFSTDASQAAPTLIQMSVSQYFNVGDVITVVASHSLGTAQFIASGSYLAATLTGTDAPAALPSIPPSTSTTRSFIAASAVSALVALAVDSNGHVGPIDPTTVQTDGNGNPIYPIVSGVSLSSGTAGATITVGTNYGGIYESAGANFTTGGLIYAVAGGVLTQDYAVVVATCQWVVVIGRAISSTQFIYEPHIPNLTNLGSF